MSNEEKVVPVVYAAPPYCEDDEIDLWELWESLVEQKWFIAAVTAVVVSIAGLYVAFATPVYEGKKIFQIGKVSVETDRGVQVFQLIAPQDLALAINQKFKDKENKKALKASVPRKAKSIIEVSYQNPSKTVIRKKLKEISVYIDKVTREAAKLYPKSILIPTRVLVPTEIDDDPVKPKSKLILAVALVLGLFIGVFAALMRKAIRSHREKKQHASA